MKLIMAPNVVDFDNETNNTVFLAGSIDNGSAENWQEYAIEQFENTDITILNPRRYEWNSGLECSIREPKLVEQVQWELNCLKNCDFILMYFARNSQSPITLLELGLFKDYCGLIVVCPEGYYRKGNVDIVCDMYNIMQLDTLDDAINYIKVQNLESSRYVERL